MKKLQQQIKHVFFDLDHTLWDFERNSNRTFEQIFKKHRIEVDLEKFKAVYNPVNHNYWKLYREEKVTKSELRYGRLKDTFDLLDYLADSTLINLLSTEYIAYLPANNEVFEGTYDILDYLKPKYHLHIITNGFEEVQHKKMTQANLISYFDKIVTSEEVGVKKPHPKIFHYALEKAGADVSESIMIGDNLEADILGAKEVGMETIFCKFNGEAAPEDLISVENLLDIKQFL